MVRIGDFPGSSQPSKSKKQAEQRKKRKEAGTGESIAPPVELGHSTMSPVLPSAADRLAVSAPLSLVPASAGRAGSEEEEELEPPLKRKRLVRLGDLPSGPSSRDGQKKEKGKGKSQATNSEQWESILKLAKTASVGDLEVSRYIAERITPPADERLLDKKSNLELGSQLVRSNIRSAVMSFAVLQRLEALDQEVQDLHEQVKAVKDELSSVKEERDLLQAQNSSLEEEKKFREEAMGALEARLATEEEERIKATAAKGELVRVCEVLERKMESERELKEKFLQDCHAAVEGRNRTEDTLQELRGSIKRQRIDAIKRWKRRFLNEECLELACDVALSVLKKCHEVHVPAGSECPSFEDYAEPLLPALGLSLEEMKERAEGERTIVPDEELDLSSEEEEEDISPLSSPPDPIAGPSSADPVVGPSSPLADPVADPSPPPEGSG